MPRCYNRTLPQEEEDAYDSACAALEGMEYRLIRGEELDRRELAQALKAARLSLESLKRSEEDSQRRYDRLFNHLTKIDERLLRIETNRFLRLWNRLVTSATQSYRRGGQVLLRSPIHPMFSRLFAGRTQQAADAYTRWINIEQAQLPSFEDHRALSESWPFRPLISIVMPVLDARPDRLEQALASIEAQSYSRWQICIAANQTAGPWLNDMLQRRPMKEPAIECTVLPEQAGIAGLSNAAAKLSGADFLAFVRADDTLSPFALHNVVSALQSDGADLLYSDEDRLDGAGFRVQPQFKPDWSSELLSSCMYLGGLLVIRRQLFEELHGFRSEFDGAHDHDLVLRLADRPMTVTHIPKVLYHRRLDDESTFRRNSSRWHQAGRRAVEDAIVRRTGRTSIVKDGPIPYSFHVQRPICEGAGLSIVVCSRNSRLLERCVTSMQKTCGDLPREFIVVHHQTARPDPSMGRVIESLGCRVVPYGGKFNFARMNNLGASEARQPYLLFLNDDVFARNGSDWAAVLMGCLQQPGVGIAGAILHYPSGAIQHAGIALGMSDGAGHCGRFQFASDLWPWLRLTRNVSAVTGACMGVPTRVFRELGGFDLQFPLNYNDVDLCLRARQAGYEVICAAASGLIHEECQTRTGVTKLNERELFYSRWADKLAKPDPFYSASLDNTEQIALRLDA